MNMINIDCDFPGGNIVVDKIKNDFVFLHQDLRDSAGWWFYWSFRVTGAGGSTLTFIFTDGEPIGVNGPAISTDQGKTWSWLGIDSGGLQSFTYKFPVDSDDVRFSFSIPYLQSNWMEFIKKNTYNAQLRSGALCISRKGRTVEYVNIGNSNAKQRILLTSRHHCCESIATYVLEGFLESVLANDTISSQWLINNAEILAIPFVDKDGVEEGDQGKNRTPRDHGRDYIGISNYIETATIREIVPKWSINKQLVVIDFHCPWIRGKHNEDIYLVGSDNSQTWEEQQHFGDILEGINRGILSYSTTNNLEYGTSWNTNSNTTNGIGISSWASENMGAKLATSIEIPYSNVGGKEITPDNAREFGKYLAKALYIYLTK
jgi:hypothetical protein